MLRSIKQLYGEKLGTSDGDIGHVKDFYFDDQKWGVRYVVVNTGPWLAGRQVLISPHAFGNFYSYGNRLLVELTRKQIENSPPIESHKPVSRQYEEAYNRFYGWPAYWDGLELWGGVGYPVLPSPLCRPSMAEGECGEASNGDDPHLRSTKSLAGYEIHTTSGSIGHVIDFMIDDKTWEVRHLIVETGHWYYGKEIVISPCDIERISYEKSAVFVNVTKKAVQEAAEYHMPRAQYHDARELGATEV
jgi:sporulation protein YlmC with PRC-barrel domain